MPFSLFKQAHVLVVGGAGFVGSNLVKQLLGLEAEVVVIDNFLSAERANLPEHPQLEIWDGSIADDPVLSRVEDQFDYVFHLATYHGNQSSIADPLKDHDNNLITTLKLFHHTKSFKRMKRLVYASTGCALAPKGEGPAHAIKEDGPVPLDLDSPYQISKVVGEMYAVYFHQLFGIPVVRARFQNIYGPGEILGAGQWRGTPATVWRNVFPTFLYRAIKGYPLVLFGGGTSSRDFIFVADIVDGLLRCAVVPGIEGEVFNLASGKEVEIRILAEKLLAATASSSELVVQPQRVWDRSIHRIGCGEKAAKVLGFRAKVELDEGILRTLDWTKAHWALIERCVNKHQAQLDAYAQGQSKAGA